MLSIPIEGQFEQDLNACYLEQLGYGAWARQLNEKAVRSFLEKTDEFSKRLSQYKRLDNEMLFDCLDELIERVSKNKKRPSSLNSKSMGSYDKD